MNHRPRPEQAPKASLENGPRKLLQGKWTSLTSCRLTPHQQGAGATFGCTNYCQAGEFAGKGLKQCRKIIIVISV